MSAPVREAFSELRVRRPGPVRVYVAGCTGEPQALADALATAPDLAADVTFLGIWIPGVNTIDWTRFHARSSSETTFLSPTLRPAFERGRTHLRPLPYTQADPWLADTPLDIAVAMVTPPDETGNVSLGVSADFTGTVLGRDDVLKLGIVNPAMPRPRDAPEFALSMFNAVCDAETPLIQSPATELPESFSVIAEHIAALIRDGDVLQFGLGNVQQAVLGALTQHRALRIHSGMVSDPVLCLLDSGAIEETEGAITTGVAIGTSPLYERMATDPRARFRPVSHTHALSTLSSIRGFTAINSVIEVDLFGQANAEFIGGRQVSGSGGLVDFLRGGALAPDGRAIAALSATAKRGTISRIVPRLAPDATTIARADLHTVVTEHGVAELRFKSLDARADALISIADPAFQSSLSNAWDEMRSAM